MAVLVLLQVGALFHFHFLISNVPAYIKVQYCHQSNLLQFSVRTVTSSQSPYCNTIKCSLIIVSRSKFSATASLGVIHRGQVKDSLALMQNYLPKDSANSSGYAEGGCLYALGLIHANHGGEITDYLLGQVRHFYRNCRSHSFEA
jgi:26S proteasome regulatory subunit N2